MNIVHQLGDALYEALPPDVAHEHFVKARQNTNDRAIDFATKLIVKAIQSHSDHMVERVKEVKKRFSCSACEGARTSHTLGCSALNEVIALLTHPKKDTEV